MAEIKVWIAGVALMADGTTMTLWQGDPKEVLRRLASAMEDIRDYMYAAKEQPRVITPTRKLDG